ncbi:MAG TPA: thioredoxin domain-containing protein [Solirubrobacteraceae bacterium]|nr:thioredoxin domain-containing protein [Solirubrobacteraceae bacterium]
MSQAERDEEDLTRKERREQARAQRKAAEQAAAAGDARRRRLTQLAGAVVVVVVAIVVILIATSGGSKSSPKLEEKPGKVSKTAEEAVAAVKEELGGIPQSGNVLGKPTAPVTMAYFGDLECPICQEFTLGALPKVIENDVRAGKLRIEYRNLETATREPEVFRNQQSAALAAGKQNLGWYYIELFYHLQGKEDSGYVTESYLQNLAKLTPGLNLTKWQADRGDQSFQAKLAVDTQEANNAGFTGTPSFLIGKTGGAMKKLEYSSLKDPASFEEAVAKTAKA